MKYRQMREVVLSTLSVATRDLVMTANWPTHISLAHVDNAIDRFTDDLDASDFDCLILDHEVENLRDLREMGITTPIISLVSENNAGARITALQAGADDCLGPVFSMSELIARVDALCRRSTGKNLVTPTLKSEVDLSLKTRIASVNGSRVSLTQTEALILRLFLENQDRLLSSDQVSTHVWGVDTEASNNLVCVHMANLRRKMDSLPWRNPIRTIRGRGYILSPE
jgi:DNA-binding response OmpR family regulator